MNFSPLSHVAPPEFFMSISMSWQRPTGNLKQLMENDGIACTIAFNKTSFLAFDNNFSFHPYNLPKLDPWYNLNLLVCFFPPPQVNPNGIHTPLFLVRQGDF